MVKCNILILHETLSNIVAILHNYVTLRIFDATLDAKIFQTQLGKCRMFVCAASACHGRVSDPLIHSHPCSYFPFSPYQKVCGGVVRDS